jgi:anti-sigma B factor antagonist
MFEIQMVEPGQVRLSGRLDAAEAERTHAELGQVDGPLTVDCSELTYISSAGISVLMEIHKRLTKAGQAFILTGMTPRVRNVFRYAGLDRVLRIE